MKRLPCPPDSDISLIVVSSKKAFRGLKTDFHSMYNMHNTCRFSVPTEIKMATNVTGQISSNDIRWNFIFVQTEKN